MSYRFEDIVMGAMGVFLVVIVAGFAVGLVAFGVDSFHAVRAEGAVVACEAKRMEGRRMSFSSTVTCVPRARGTRNDTLTVQGVQP